MPDLALFLIYELLLTMNLDCKEKTIVGLDYDEFLEKDKKDLSWK